MKQIVEKLKQLNLTTANEEDIVSIMLKAGRGGGIITDYHPAYTENDVPNFFVRASNYNSNKEQIISTDRLSYPPLKFNEKYQRASTPQKPMFYAVRYQSIYEKDSFSAIKTCLLETIVDYEEMVSPGSRVAISLRYNMFPIKLYSIFNWQEFQDSNPQYKEVVAAFIEAINERSESEKEDTKIFLNYLSEIFCLPVGVDQNLYKPSAIITQYLIDKMINLNIEIDGIVFPSTKVKGKELNVALIPAKSDQKLVVAKVLDGVYKPNRKVEIQRIAEIKYGSKDVNFNEIKQFEIDLIEKNSKS